MKIAIAQLNYTIGDFQGNQNKITDAVRQAKRSSADIVCFGEMATTGFPAEALLDYDEFLDLSDDLLKKIADISEEIAVVIGAPYRDFSSGEDIIRSGVFFIYEKNIRQIGSKILPEEMNDMKKRKDLAGWVGELVEFKGKKIGFRIGAEGATGKNQHSAGKTGGGKEEEPDVIINISASLFDQEVSHRRITFFRSEALEHRCPVFFINHSGAQGGLVFDGGSLAVSHKGVIAAELPYFEEDMVVLGLEELQKTVKDQLQTPGKMEMIEKALILGVRDYFDKSGFQKAILGLSGGLDSALVCVLAVKALGSENVRAVYLRGPFSSDHSEEDARKLAQNLNVDFDEIDIVRAYETVNQTLLPVFGERPFDVTEENIQARLRGLMLMAISNKLGYVLLNASNKSEAAVGYTTLYGDMTGGLAVIADIYKSEVFELARFTNRKKEIIPHRILVKPPSAELRPGQKDSDSLPDYDVLDSILYAFIEESQSPQEIINRGYDAEMVKRILRIVNQSEFKRNQAAPAIRVSKKAFETDRTVPVVNGYMK